jgi:hypothetical protein
MTIYCLQVVGVEAPWSIPESNGAYFLEFGEIG